MAAPSPVAQRAIRRVSTPLSSRRPSDMSEEAASLEGGAIYRTICEEDIANKPVLVYETSYGLDTEFVLTGDVTSIGRKSSNTIRFNDMQISKEHCKIQREPSGAYCIYDLKSSNGTYVNGKRVRGVRELCHNDKLEIGGVSLVYKTQASPEEQRKLDLKRRLRALPVEDRARMKESVVYAAREPENVGVFQKAEQIRDVQVLRDDYERLRICHAISSAGIGRGIVETVETSLNKLFEILAADDAACFLEDTETGQYEIVAAVPIGSRSSAGLVDTAIPFSATIMNHVRERMEGVVVADASDDVRFQSAQSIMVKGIRSLLLAPLIAHGPGGLRHCIGILQIVAKGVGAFQPKDLNLAMAVANQTAIAIQNNLLLKKVEEEARKSEQLHRFLPPPVVLEMIASKGREIQRGVRQIVGTVVFADIRGFTQLSERMEPQDVVEILNEYFDRLVKIVFDREGVLDKYIGDALMALFGTLEREKDPVYNSVCAAIEFRDAIRDMNKERAASGNEPIGVGVGVNTGPLVAGFVGSKQRLEYTCIGDTVNVSSRLCAMAEADQVLIARSTADHETVRGRFEMRFVESRQVKGKDRRVDVFEVLRKIPPQEWPSTSTKLIA